MDKHRAIERVNSHAGGTLLSNGNTCFANINKATPVWWLTVPVAKFRSQLHFLLCKRNGGLIWIRIPAGHFPDPARTFRYRSDRDAIHLEISCEKQRYLSDVTGLDAVRFGSFVEHQFE